jgi:hypothetical protein
LTALVYLTFEGRAWPFERAKPPVPPRRKTDEYIGEAAGCSPAQEIANAKT